MSGFTVSWQRVVLDAGGTAYVPAGGASVQSVTAGPATTGFTLPASSFNPAAALYSVTVGASNAAGAGPATGTASPVAPVTAVSARAVVLSAGTMSALAADTPAATASGSVLVWHAPAPAQVSALNVGAVLVASPGGPAGHGLLDKVASIDTTGGDYTVTTVPAALTDVFTTLSLAATTDPLIKSAGAAGAAGRFRPTAAGVRKLPPAPHASIDFSRTLSLGFDYRTGSAGAGASFSGQLNVTPDLSLSLNLVHGFAGVPDGVGLSASASVTVTDTVTAEAHASYSRTIGEIVGDPIDIQVGPVPVIIVPKMPVTLSVSGKIGLRVEASAAIGSSLSWDSRHPDTLRTSDLSQPIKVTAGPLPGLTTTGQIVAKLSLQPQLDLYDIGGPNLQADAILTGLVDLNPPASGAYLSVTPSLNLAAGVDVDFLGYHASFEQRLASRSFTPFQILKPPTASLAITPANPQVLPGQSVQLTSARTDGAGGHPVTWSLTGDAGDAIAAGGRFTAAEPPGRTVTVYATDETGATGVTTITVGTPFDATGNLQASQHANDLGADVTWTPPSQSGGYPITGYTLTTSSGGPTVTTTATTVSLSNLHSGILYTITVYPTNSAGQTGPAASTTIQVTPPCTNTFTGGGQGTGTDWGDGTNWTTGQPPTPADWVCTTGHSITLPAAEIAVQGIQAPGGGLTIPQGGNLTVTTSAAFTGSLTGPGSLSAPAGSAVTLGTSLALRNGLRLVNRGSAEVQAGCCAQLSGGSVLENAGTLTIDEGAVVQAGDTSAENRILNDPGAAIAFDGSSSVVDTSISVPVTDSGTIDASGGLGFGPVTFAGNPVVNLTGGTVQFSAATFTATPTIRGPGATSFGSIEVPGASTLAGNWSVNSALVGPGSLTVPAGAVATLGSGLAFRDGVRLVNRGSAEIQGGCCDVLLGGSVIENAGTLAVDDGAIVHAGDGSPGNQVLNDAGGTISFSPATPDADATIGVPLTDSGTINAVDGRLRFGGSTFSGAPTIGGAGTTSFAAIAVPAASTLAGRWTVTGPLSGPGSLTVPAGSTATLGGSASLAGGVRLVNRGTTKIQGGCCVQVGGGSILENVGTLAVDNAANVQLGDNDAANQVVNDPGGTIAFGGSGPAGVASITVPLANSGTIDASDGSLSFGVATLSGSPVIGGAGSTSFAAIVVPAATSLAGHWTLTGGLSGQGSLTVPAGSTATLRGSASLSGGVRLVNRGSAEIQGGCCVQFSGGSVLENAGTVTIDGAANVQPGDNGANRVVNDGGGTIAFAAASSGGFASITVPLADSGTIDASGGLSFGAVTFLGSPLVRVRDGVLAFGASTFTATPALTGPGTTTFASIAVPAPTSLAGRWAVGSGLSGPGSLTVPAGSAAMLDGSVALTGGVRLVNRGMVEIRGGCCVQFAGGSILENAGTLTVDSAANVQPGDNDPADRILNDAGATIAFSGASSAESASIAVPLSDSGTINTSGGHLSFGGATLSGAPAIGGSGTTSFASLAVPAAASLTGRWTSTGGMSGPGWLTVPAGSTATMGGSAALSGGARLVNRGSVEIQGGCCVQFSAGSVLENAGTLTVDGGANVQIADNDAANQLLNDAGGTIAFGGSSAAASASIGVPLTDNGAIRTTRGTLAIGSLANLSSGVLAGGSYQALGGALDLPGTITTNRAAIVVGPSGALTSGGANALATLASNAGSLSLATSLTTTASLTNSGHLTVSAGVLRTHGFTQTAGTPADPASLAFGVSGAATPGTDFGQLVVTAGASLGGTLAIQTAAGYAPVVGTAVPVVSSGQTAGTFSRVTGLQLPSTHWSVEYAGSGVTLKVATGSSLPRAAYAASTYSPSVGQSVSFSGTGSTGADGPIVAYRWVWGDGSSDGTGASPTHVFASAGKFSVGLYVTDGYGQTAAVGHGIVVSAANQPPTAAYTPSTYTPALGQTVAFDGSASTDPDGRIVAYRWAWSDGTPDGSGPAPTHAFTAQGRLSVALYVTDNGGKTAAVGHGITVGPPNQPPTAAYTPSTYTPTVGQTVAFNGTASTDPDGRVVAYRWVWGDGTPDGSGATPTHAFAAAGRFSVGLYATDNGGKTAAVGHGIAVSPPNQAPIASYAPSTYTPTAGQTVAFDGSASTDPDGTIVAYRWVWGDGTPDGTGRTPTHVFTQAGKYSVALYVTDNGGRTTAVGHGITVSSAGV